MREKDENERQRSEMYSDMMEHSNDGIPNIDETLLHNLAKRKRLANGEKPTPFTKRVMFIECPICFSKMQQEI